MSKEAEDFVDNALMHFGKKGMKWGVRNEDRIGAGNTLYDRKPVTADGVNRRPSVARNLLVGGLGNGKGRYTDPAAQAKRARAGKNAIAGILLGVGGQVIAGIGNQSSNPTINTGAKIVGNFMGTAGTVTSLIGLGQGVSSTLMENKSRK